MCTRTCFPKIWQKLHKQASLFAAGFFIAMQSYGNPILPPPMITEINFSSTGNWSIELCMWGMYEGTLDDFRILGLYDTAQFAPGITFLEGLPFAVTEDDFQSDLFIDQSGDCLFLEYFDGTYWMVFEAFGLRWGNIPENYLSNVSAPAGEESIAWLALHMCESSVDYWTVKELPNSIGYNPFEVGKRAAFSGFVWDKSGNPIPNLFIKYCNISFPTNPQIPVVFTNQFGYFHTDSMFCRKYYVSFIHDGDEIGDSAVFIEPDSANYFEFTLDTLLTDIGEIQKERQQFSVRTVPNPFSGQTRFVIDSSHSEDLGRGIIKIYNSEGIVVDILPVSITGGTQELIYRPSERGLACGVYYYNLETAGNRTASGKMIIGQ